MGSASPPLTSLLMVVSGWVHRHQLILIELLQAENRMLKEHLRGKSIKFTDAERALLARKAKAVGRKALLELDTIVSPDTSECVRRGPRRLDQGERLGKMIFFGQASLRHALTDYVAHYDERSKHRGLENRLIRATPAIAANDAALHCRTRLGAMLSYYHRVAA